jgi:hypothetical protein
MIWYESIAVEYRDSLGAPGLHRWVLPLTGADQSDPRLAAALAYMQARLQEQIAAANEPPSMGGLG